MVTGVQMSDFERLVQEAVDAHFSGWDFSYLHGRQTELKLPWDYRARVMRYLPTVNSLLDMGTGGGEFLSSLTPLPSVTYATEGYAPNLAIARKRLAPFGVTVVDTTADEENQKLPFEDKSFELVINRHESYDPAELYRILKPGGRFFTQQVGGADNVGLNHFLQGQGPYIDLDWQITHEVERFEAAGFEIEEALEAHPETTFNDIGAVVYYLKAIPWQIEDFSVEKYHERLLALHEHIHQNNGFTLTSHRFFLCAIRR